MGVFSINIAETVDLAIFIHITPDSYGRKDHSGFVYR